MTPTLDPSKPGIEFTKCQIKIWFQELIHFPCFTLEFAKLPMPKFSVSFKLTNLKNSSIMQRSDHWMWQIASTA